MDSLASLLEKAKRLAKARNRGPEAVKINTEILKRDPAQVGSYTRRGACYLEQGDLTAAEKDYRQALERDPNNRIALNRLKDIDKIRNPNKAGAKTAPARAVAHKRGHHSVYVVELNRSALKDDKLLAANPNRDHSKPCVYVGMTGLTPEKRFENHKKGHKANRYVRKHGERLLPHFYERFNPMPYEEALRKEAELARELRDRGYAVWSN